jgi:Cytochrome c biogenesis protein
LDYLLSFLEGIITFVSPCLLPMLPVYISYFAGGSSGGKERSKGRALKNAFGFVLGFTIIFVLLGAAAGTFGSFVSSHRRSLDIVGGIILVLFGLNFMSVINIGFLNHTFRLDARIKSFNFLTSAMLGVVFSIGWTPCVGAFLGSALMLAANSQETLKGIIMLLFFSLGLGLPFMISALLIDSLKSAFDAIKRNYKAVSFVSGLLLIIVGVLMMTGQLNKFLSLLTFR